MTTNKKRIIKGILLILIVFNVGYISYRFIVFGPTNEVIIHTILNVLYLPFLILYYFDKRWK